MASVLMAETQYEYNSQTENVIHHTASCFVGSRLLNIILRTNECSWQDMYRRCNKRRSRTEFE
jgi:hypothetical protein